MSAADPADPFGVLGVPRDANEADVRARYLELVKQYPPDREPEKFREIRAAYEAARDPLSIAKRLIVPASSTVPPWSDALEAQKRNPPRLSPAFLLSLGNRAAREGAASHPAPDDAAASAGPPGPHRSESEKQPTPDFTTRTTDIR